MTYTKFKLFSNWCTIEMPTKRVNCNFDGCPLYKYLQNKVLPNCDQTVIMINNNLNNNKNVLLKKHRGEVYNKKNGLRLAKNYTRTGRPGENANNS